MKRLILLALLLIPINAQALTYELSVNYRSCGRWVTATYNYKSWTLAKRGRAAFQRNPRFQGIVIRVKK